ncbi:MAG: UbiA family prenyltransferase [Candidatus Thermoplasmatota archaeon]|mgnify:CR=1 FL=1
MASLGRLRASLDLVRPGNAAMAAAAGATGFVLAGGVVSPALVVAATLPPFLVAAFGNAINDLSDAELDRSAHPNRPLPSGRLGRRAAWVLASLALAAALATALPGGWPAVAFAGANALLLVAYEARLKATGLPGNILVAVLVGSTFLYGGIVATGQAPAAPMLLLLAAMASLTNLARELLKDVEDVDADRGHRDTLPLRVGQGQTRLLAFALVNLALVTSVVAFVRTPAGWWTPWLILLAAADAVFLLGACLAWVNVGLAQRLLKLAMMVALLAFLSGASAGP